MAEIYQMTWRPNRRSWVKKVTGKSHDISCRQLRQLYPDLVESDTKRGSYKAANQWWVDKQTELEEESKAAEPTLEDLVKKSRKSGLTKPEKVIFQRELQHRLSKAAPVLEAAGIPDNLETMSEGQMRLLDVTTELALNNQIVEREADSNRSIKHMAELWIEKRARLSRTSKKVSVGAVNQNKAHLATLKEWIAESETIDDINSAWLADFRDMLLDKVDEGDLKPKSALNILGSVAMFVDWLALERELILRPNLMSKRGWKQLTYDPQPYPMTVATWRATYSVADDPTKLFLLLMANCGYTAKDISDLKPSEVNWQKGRIKRRRSKGENYENAPIVDRPLWPETFQLLKAFGQREGKQVLVSEAGTELVTANRKDLVGERVKSAIRAAGFSSGPHYRPKDIRSGCATLIDAGPFDGWETYFLGQSPDGVAERHYVGTNSEKQEQFDELTTWLRTKWIEKK